MRASISRFQRLLINVICISLLNVGPLPIHHSQASAKNLTPSVVAVDTVNINLTATGFDPKSLTIKVGTEVTWVNNTNQAYFLQSGSPTNVYLPLISRGGASESNAATTPQQDAETITTQPIPAIDSFSGSLPVGGSFSHTFNEPGAFFYSLITKPEFTGQIIVEESLPAGATGISGRLLDTNSSVQGQDIPIVGAAVSLFGTEYKATSDSNGRFSIIAYVAGRQVLDIDTSSANPASDGSAYAGFREKVELVEHQANSIARPFYLPRIATNSLAKVDPAKTTTVNNGSLGVSMVVPPATAKNGDDNSNFSGQLSISEVPSALAPAALPAALNPGLLITIQPVGVRFATPVPITFPNIDNLPARSETDIWSLDPERGVFVVVATGRVSSDGKRIETISGGIRAADWHFTLPPILSGDGSQNNNENQQPNCPVNTASFTDASSGNHIIDHTLAAYQSLSKFRSLRLVYNSLLADPRPILINDMVIPRRSTVPVAISSRLTVSGTPQGTEQFIDTKGLNENADEPIRQTTLFDASGFTTGIYPYVATFTNHFTFSSVSADVKGKLLVRNERANALGAGWGLDGVDRVYLQTNGDVLLTQGNGGTLVFSKSQPGEFENAVDYSTGLFAQDVVVGDFNKDSKLDFATGTTFLSGDVYVHLGDGTGKFGVATHYPTNGQPNALVTADLDKDGNLDFVTGNNQATISILWGQGNGTFSAPDNYPIPLGASFITNPSGIATGDFNGDGFLDIATANKNGKDVAVFLSIGARTYASATNYALAEQPDDIVAADFNLDGKLDLATANNTNIAILYGANGGVFGQLIKFGRTTYALALTTGDFNRDGAPDLATTGSTFLGLGAAITVFTNDRHGGFFQPQVVDMGQELLPADIASADINGDSLPDLVTANKTYNLSLVLGDGEGGFTKPTNLPIKSSTSFLALGDFNQDQLEDIAFSGRLPTTQIEYAVSVQLNRSPGPIFVSPAGDYSTLIKNDDGSFTRRMKDGTEARFDAQGLQTAVVDRNGNSTQYSYDGSGRLTAITDPVGKVTTLTYANGLLSRITDPTGRNTTIEHDSAGNLTRITDPDNSNEQFAYDAQHHLTSHTSPLGDVTKSEYNFAGRHIKAILPDGSIRTLDTGLSAALVDPASGLGTQSNPAPVTRPGNLLATYTDGAGMVTKYALERLGNANAVTDPAGLTTQYQRDPDGNPTQTKLPSGAIYDSSYDNQGNQLLLTNQTVKGTTQFAYDPTFNQVTSITDPYNQRTTIAYDTKGNATQITTPLNRQLQFSYDNRGLLTGLTDTLGTQSTMSYDSQGNLTQLALGSDANQRTVATTYTAAGYPQQITDAMGRTFGFQYDAQGQLTSESLPGNRTITYQYNAMGDLTSITPPGRPNHGFEYNALGLLTAYVPPTVTGSGMTRTTYEYNAAQALTKVNRPDGKSIVYSYDNAGRLSNLALARGSLQYDYDASSGHLSTIQAPDNVNLGYSYSGELLTGVNWSGPISGSVSYQYDSNYRLTELAVNGNAINYQYDADNAVTQAGDLRLSYNATTGLYTGSTLGSVTDSWQYNEFSEPTRYTASYNGAATFDTQYTRDKLGRIITLVETINGVTTTYNYSYDAAGRLNEVKRNNAIYASYTYNPNGNRLSYTNAGNAPVNSTYDNQDRLLQSGGAIYSYTANGELQSKTENGQTTTYSYDEVGNLIGVNLPDGTQIAYLIDGQKRRVGKKVNGTLVQRFVYQDQLNPVAELDDTGNVIARYIYGNRSNLPDYMIKGGVTYRIITDHLGSPRLVVNGQTGEIVQRMDYDEFGNVLQDTNPGFQPFGFAGGIYDHDTALVRFGTRDYSPQSGRWTAKDPIGFAGGDSNLYNYVANDPLNQKDPSGKCAALVGGVVTVLVIAGIVYIITKPVADLGPAPTTDLSSPQSVEEYYARQQEFANRAQATKAGLPLTNFTDPKSAAIGIGSTLSEQAAKAAIEKK